MTAFGTWVDDELDAIRSKGQWRALRPFDAKGPVGLLDGHEVVSYASNDYLGLASHPQVIAAAHEALDRWGTGANASRLVVGSRPVHAELEAALACWKRTEAALVFPTGYAANLSVLTAFAGDDCLIISDAVNHASIIDGCRLSRSPISVARHNDVDHVDELLKNRKERRALVVVDAVFSMDGDEADVAALAQCCARHGALLVLDEAHQVFEPSWVKALPAELDVLRVVTLSKALGSQGGAVCGSARAIDLLVNRARPFIFTTGLTPTDAAAALEAVRICDSPEGGNLRARLAAHVQRVRPGHPSPIVPLIIGDEADAVAAAATLLARGIHIPAIRPPTVSPGTSRLRIALSAAHTDAMIDDIMIALDDLGLAP